MRALRSAIHGRSTILAYALLLMPILNVAHECGHWLAYRVMGVPAQMRLQNVELPDEPPVSRAAQIIGNISGPGVNVVIIALGFLFPLFTLSALLMALHRLGPQLLGIVLYLGGSSRFTNDETYLVSESSRLVTSLIAALIYSAIAVAVCRRRGITSGGTILFVLLAGSIAWVLYGMGLSRIDALLF